uniref:Uncharacterized protein n=1 Tax=Pyrodinium bahamense TaxID=73915 RepID=A0A7S0B4T4_9DINO|mmetsp:Transcript_49894/g.138611  ORF Transcript_49894/g.138611 Transcript_49894/m.138611 type:complete len:131 (+) Transcript_49894:76-468(+)
MRRNGAHGCAKALHAGKESCLVVLFLRTQQGAALGDAQSRRCKCSGCQRFAELPAASSMSVSVATGRGGAGGPDLLRPCKACRRCCTRKANGKGTACTSWRCVIDGSVDTNLLTASGRALLADTSIEAEA